MSPTERCSFIPGTPHTWNTAAACLLYGPLQTLEVTLRNAVHDAMSLRHGCRWLDDSSTLRAAERRMVGEATERMHAIGRPPATGRLVAELSYGFWVGLFANAYDATLSPPTLRWLDHHSSVATVLRQRPDELRGF